MFLKFFVLFFLFLSTLYAQYEMVKIGKIDEYYQDKITQNQLQFIIDEIEKTLEAQLGVNIFGYSQSGKPIDILYLSPSKKKINLKNGLKKIEIIKRKIDRLQEHIVLKKEYIRKKEDELQSVNNKLNQEINKLNLYIETANKEDITSKTRYQEIQKYIKTNKQKIKKQTNIFYQKKTKYNNSLKSYNQQISLHNTLVNQYNRLQRKIEILTRSMKEIKGAAKGYTQTIFKTVYKDGKQYNTRETKNYMEKIEIYGFDNFDQLKTILAHEILHLVGVGHIQRQGALMNPILQENQVKNLYLTPDDIINFKRLF